MVQLTLNVYGVPFASPVTTIGDVPGDEPMKLLGVERAKQR